MNKLSATKKLSPTDYLMLGAIILLAFALRVFQLDAQSLRGDEAASALYASYPLANIVEISRTVDPHPPTFYISLHFWEILTGHREFALRFWTLIPALLSIAVIFALTRNFLGRRVAVIAAFLMAINSFHIWYSQDLRSYTWLLFIGILSSFALLKVLRHPSRKWWIVYIILSLLLIYIHYYALFIFVFHGVFVLWKRESRALFWRWLRAMATISLGFLPWFIYSWGFISKFTGDFKTVAPPTLLWRGMQAYGGGIILPTPQISLWQLSSAAFAILGGWILWRKNRQAAVFFLLYFGITFLGIMTLSLRGNAFTERYLLGGLPGYLVLMAVGAAWLWRQKSLWMRSIFMVLGGILLWQNVSAVRAYAFDPALAKAPQWRETFNFIAETYNPETDALLFNFPETAVSYYLDLQHPNSHPPAFLVPSTANPSPAELDAMMRETLQNYRRAYFLPVNIGGWDDAHGVETWLNRYADKLGQADFHWMSVGVFLTPAAINSEMTRQPVRFENGIELEGFRIANDAKHSSQPLDLRLYWKTMPTAEPLTVFVQLIDDTGFRRGGSDSQPVQGSYPTTEWGIGERVTDAYLLALDTDPPMPTRYQIWVGFYNPKTGERVSVVDAAGNPIADHIVLNFVLTDVTVK